MEANEFKHPSNDTKTFSFNASAASTEMYHLTQSRNWLKGARQQFRDTEKQMQLDELDNRIE